MTLTPTVAPGDLPSLELQQQGGCAAGLWEEEQPDPGKGLMQLSQAGAGMLRVLQVSPSLELPVIVRVDITHRVTQ